MATKHQRMQSLIRFYKFETGQKEVDMHEVAAWAVRRGFPLPKPAEALDMLAKEFAKAAREEIRHDSQTGRPYRANHAFPTSHGAQSSMLWIDIDEAPRSPMLKSLMKRREQMVGDGLQLSLDADHWNGSNLNEEPIVIPLDFTDDVEWRKNAPDDEEQEAS